MSWRAFIILPLLGILIYLLGHYLPVQLQAQPPLPLPQFPLDSPYGDSASVDLRQLEQKRPVISESELLSFLEKEINPVKTLSKKGVPHMLFGEGAPLYTIYAKASEVLRKYNCPIHDGLEIRPHQILQFEYSCGSTWSSNLRFEIEEDFTTDFVKIALLFQVDSTLSIDLLQKLSQSEFPYTLLINPFKMHPSLPYDLAKLTNKEVIHSLPMEPSRYPYINPGKNTLLIHHKKEQVEQILKEADELLPNARGSAPFYGDRAINHTPLVKKLFSSLATRSRVFLGNLSHNNEIARKTCLEESIRCLYTRWPSKDFDAVKAMDRTLANAKRSGQNILILPLNLENYQDVASRISGIEESGVEFVLFSELKEEAP